MIVSRTKVVMYPLNVLRRVDKQENRILYRLGAYLRTTMQRSMRYKNKQSAPPGQPPYAHKKGSRGPLLRKLISFFVDRGAKSVVCGPKIFAGSKLNASMPLPELLDKGGVESQLHAGKSVAVEVKPHPFTAPVFSDGGKRFQQLFKEVPL